RGAPNSRAVRGRGSTRSPTSTAQVISRAAAVAGISRTGSFTGASGAAGSRARLEQAAVAQLTHEGVHVRQSRLPGHLELGHQGVGEVVDGAFHGQHPKQDR